MDTQCRKCGEQKALKEFYKGHYSRDCRTGICKECVKARARENRLAKIDYYREYDRRRGNRQDPGYLKHYRSSNPQKWEAHMALNNAVRDGRLRKLDACEECGNTFAIHGHHDDYSKPLDVRWLCAACHRQWHMKHGEAKTSVPIKRAG